MILNKLLTVTDHDPTESEIILADILNKDRSYLYSHSKSNISSKIVDKFAKRISQRKNHKPIAYILGCKEFYALKFFVDQRVLIPRPETEKIVDLVLNLAESRDYKLTICDVGTGSGCIATVLAKNLPQSKIYATDISKEALNVARKNAKYHHLEDKITFLNGDLLHPLPEKVDVIVANLPYIKTSDMNNLKPQISKWEPRIALYGGKNGKQFYNRLFSTASNYLKPGGQLFYELDGKIYTKTFQNLRGA